MLPGIIGSLQANEALKLIVGYGEPLVGRLLTFDAQGTRFAEVKVRQDPQCPTCGTPRFSTKIPGHIDPVLSTESR